MNFKFNIDDEVVLLNEHGSAIVKTRQWHTTFQRNWYGIRMKGKADLYPIHRGCGISEGLLMLKSEWEKQELEFDDLGKNI